MSGEKDDDLIFLGSVPLWKLSLETRRMIRADNVKPTDLVAWPVTQTYSGVTSEQTAALRKACLKPRWSKAKKRMMAKRRKAPNLFASDFYERLHEDVGEVIMTISPVRRTPAQAACADPASRFPLGKGPAKGKADPTYSETSGKGASSLRAAEDIMAALRDVVKGGR